MSVTRAPFGITRSGQPVELLTLRCGVMEAEILTFGATIRALRVPDRSGAMVDVVLGYDSVAGYENNDGYLGALIGRYANRIRGAAYVIDGQRIPLEANEGEKQLHGGFTGFSHRLFEAEIAGDSSVRLRLTSPDGEGGHPGNLTLCATYTLTDTSLILRYEAECDKPTHCNVTNHSYFNLNGSGTVLGHTLRLESSRFTPIDKDSIPTAMAQSAIGTAFDFTAEKTIGQDIFSKEEQLLLAGGYDHNFILSAAQGLHPAARLTGDQSGIVMETWTQKPGIQIYSANFLATDSSTKSGLPYGQHDAICLETQFFPDSPNHSEWGDVVLRPGRRYDYTTEYRFTTAQ